MGRTKADRIVFLRKKGLPYADIAIICDCDVGYVSASLQRHSQGGQRECDKTWTRNNPDKCRANKLRYGRKKAAERRERRAAYA